MGYYYRPSGSTDRADDVGPIPWEGIERLVEQGGLTEADQVRAEGQGDWIHVASLERLASGGLSKISFVIKKQPRVDWVGPLAILVCLGAAYVVVSEVSKRRSSPVGADLVLAAEELSTVEIAKVPFDPPPAVSEAVAAPSSDRPLDEKRLISEGAVPQTVGEGRATLDFSLSGDSGDLLLSESADSESRIEEAPAPTRILTSTTSRTAARLSEIIANAEGEEGRPSWPYTDDTFLITQEFDSPALWHRSSIPYTVDRGPNWDAHTAALNRASMTYDEGPMSELLQREQRGENLSADELLILGGWLFATKEFLAARELFARLAMREDAPPLTWSFLAMCLEADKPAGEVLGIALDAVAADPYDDTAFALLGFLSHRSGDVDTRNLCLRRIAELDYWGPYSEALARTVLTEGPDAQFFSKDGKQFRAWASGSVKSGLARANGHVTAISGDGSVIGGWTEIKVGMFGGSNKPSFWGDGLKRSKPDKAKVKEHWESILAFSAGGRYSLIKCSTQTVDYLRTPWTEGSSILWDNELSVDSFALSKFEVETRIQGKGKVLAKVTGLQCTSISDDGGIVVGSMRLEIPGRQPYWNALVWEVGMDAVLLPIANGSTGSVAEGVSPNGRWVVGASSGRACRWDLHDGGPPHFLGGPGTKTEIGTHANAVSDDGRTVVGLVYTDSGRVQGRSSFVWTESGGMVRLRDLSNHVENSALVDVSADGSIAVGWGFASRGQRAIVWTSREGVQEVVDWALEKGLDVDEERFGWELRDAQGISTDGKTLAGTAKTFSGSRPWTINWQTSSAPLMEVEPSQGLGGR